MGVSICSATSVRTASRASPFGGAGHVFGLGADARSRGHASPVAGGTRRQSESFFLAPRFSASSDSRGVRETVTETVNPDAAAHVERTHARSGATSPQLDRPERVAGKSAPSVARVDVAARSRVETRHPPPTRDTNRRIRTSPPRTRDSNRRTPSEIADDRHRDVVRRFATRRRPAKSAREILARRRRARPRVRHVQLVRGIPRTRAWRRTRRRGALSWRRRETRQASPTWVRRGRREGGDETKSRRLETKSRRLETKAGAVRRFRRDARRRAGP